MTALPEPVTMPRTVSGWIEQDDAAATMTAVLRSQEVRREPCRLCPAQAQAPCSMTPPQDHLARWLDAYAAGRITRENLKAIIGGLVVITTDQLVPARRTA